LTWALAADRRPRARHDDGTLVIPAAGTEPEKQCWRTPGWAFAPLMEEFRFDVDVCASPENALAHRYITREDNALAMPWSGAHRVRHDIQGWGRSIRAAFLQPPYSRRVKACTATCKRCARGEHVPVPWDYPGTGAFVERGWEQSRAGLTVVALVETATDTTWWRAAFRRADEVRIGLRLKFCRPDGSAGGQPPGGVGLLVFRPHVPVGGWPQGPRVSLWDPKPGGLVAPRGSVS